MRSFIQVSVLIAAIAASPSLVAQWDVRMPQGVPRNAKGEPDLNGPVPRTTDGKPDLSGVWQGGNAANQAARPMHLPVRRSRVSVTSRRTSRKVFHSSLKAQRF